MFSFSPIVVCDSRIVYFLCFPLLYNGTRATRRKHINAVLRARTYLLIHGASPRRAPRYYYSAYNMSSSGAAGDGGGGGGDRYALRELIERSRKDPPTGRVL